MHFCYFNDHVIEYFDEKPLTNATRIYDKI